MPKLTSFGQCYAMSDDDKVRALATKYLLAEIPGAMRVERASKVDDLRGTDYWVERSNGDALSIDVKARDEDPILAYGSDDFVVEIWSDRERGKIGWTLDSSKRTDYVLYLWKDTGRGMLVDFPRLCRLCTLYRDEWCREFQNHEQQTRFNGVLSTGVHIFVTRRVYSAAAYRHYGAL